MQESIPTFDPVAVNATIKGIFMPTTQGKDGSKSSPPIRVERIATCMGCVMTTCVVDVDQVASITNALIGWAKPIVEVQNNKARVCMEWRKKLEGGVTVQHVNVPSAAAAAAAASKMPSENLIVPNL